jgi:type II secretory pathway pseudopilin PulG
MRLAPIHKSEAFTRIELMVVIIVVCGLSFMVVSLIFAYSAAGAHARQMSCINNLKQIGTAYRFWAFDHNDHYPASESVTKGGWSELLTNADQGFLCWTNYAIMAKELGQSPKVIACPSDDRRPADFFTNFANANVSYFVGVSADNRQPNSLLGGDRNLGPGTNSGPDYGFSPKSGKGNDVAIQTNSQASPVCWSLKMHSFRIAAGLGNILMGDGSAQEPTSANFRQNWQPVAGLTTNWPAGHFPSSPSVRILFP